MSTGSRRVRGGEVALVVAGAGQGGANSCDVAHQAFRPNNAGLVSGLWSNGKNEGGVMAEVKGAGVVCPCVSGQDADLVVCVSPRVLACAHGDQVTGFSAEVDGLPIWYLGFSDVDSPFLSQPMVRERVRCRFWRASVGSQALDPIALVLKATGGVVCLSQGQELRTVLVDPDDYTETLPVCEREARRARALVVGLGSVGSDVATRLARLGVEVVGCDPDVLEVKNLVRWGLPVGLKHVGRGKAAVWAAALDAQVPGACVTGVRLDVVRASCEFRRLFERIAPDLVVVATDTLDSRLVTNALAVEYGVPALYVALSDGAASVRLEVVSLDKGSPCHLCGVLAEGGLGRLDSASPKRAAYAGSLPTSMEALPVDVSLAAGFATRVATQILRGEPWETWFSHGSQRGNVTLIALRPDWWLFDDAWSRLTHAVSQSSSCPVCQTRNQEVM